MQLPDRLQPSDTPLRQGPAGERPLVVPYDDPAKALESAKVLVPYADFVRVWNLAHPDKPLEGAPPVNGAAMADVRYEVKLVKSADPSQGPGTLQITLRMQVLALAAPLKRPVVIAMPLGGMAVSDATFAGKPAALQVGPGGMVLALPPELFDAKGKGDLAITAVATPKFAVDTPAAAGLISPCRFCPALS